MWEDREFIASGMNGNFIVFEILGNEHVLIEMTTKSLEVSTVIHPFLELTNESGCKRIDANSPVVQLEDKEEMVFSRGRERGLINRDFKVNGGLIFSLRPNPFIDLFSKVNGPVEEKGISFQAFVIEL